MSDSVVVRRPGEGQAWWMLGGLYEVKVSSEESNGALTLLEMTIPPEGAPPPHTHPGAEDVYVLEGTLRYHIGDEVYEGSPGSHFHIPAGVLERFEPISTVRILVLYTPGGIDRFFAEAGEPAATRTLPPPPSAPPDIERLIAIGARHGMLLKPPAQV